MSEQKVCTNRGDAEYCGHYEQGGYCSFDVKPVHCLPIKAEAKPPKILEGDILDCKEDKLPRKSRSDKWRHQLFELITDPYCRRHCGLWDKQGKYCFAADAHRDNPENHCELIRVAVKRDLFPVQAETEKIDGNELPSAAYDKYFTPPDSEPSVDPDLLTPEANKLSLLATALRDVLIADGVLGYWAEPSGPELLTAAGVYISAKKAKLERLGWRKK